MAENSQMDKKQSDIDPDRFDSDMFAEEKSDDTSDTISIDFNCLSDELRPAQKVIYMLETRQPLIRLYDKLKHQKDNNTNSAVLNVNFKPAMNATLHQKLDGKFMDLVSEHRNNLISDILGCIDTEVKTLTDEISSCYKAEIKFLNENKATEGLKTFVESVRKVKITLDLERNEAKARLNNPYNSVSSDSNNMRGGRTFGRQQKFRGALRGGYRARKSPYN